MECLYFLAVMNKATMSCCVSVYFQIFLVCVPTSGIFGSNDNSRFNILMNYQIIFPSKYIILCSQPLCKRVPIYTLVVIFHLLLYSSQCHMWEVICDCDDDFHFINDYLHTYILSIVIVLENINIILICSYLF